MKTSASFAAPAALLATVLQALPVVATAQAASAPAASPQDQHAAVCVAALEVNTEDLAQQIKAGKETLRPLLLDRLVAGTTFVGDAYLRGDIDEKRARALANQALQAQQSLTAAELAARQAACADEGTRLFTSSNVLEQLFVKRAAKRRLERLLGG